MATATATATAARPPPQQQPRPWPDRLDPDRQQLAADHVGLARRLARPFQAAWPAERDEFESVALAALVDAARRYDPDRFCVRFSTYAWPFIRGSLQNARAHQRRRLEVHRLAAAAAAATRPAEESAGAEAGEFVNRCLQALPARQAEIVRLIYCEGLSGAEAADRIGVSAWRVSIEHGHALDRLLAVMGGGREFR